MKNSKKSAVQLVKVFKQLNGEFNKTNSDLNAKIVVNYLFNNKSVSDSNKEIWFKNWIIGKDTFDKVSLESGYSISTLQAIFLKCLKDHQY